jgi:hypothetical protein
MNAVYLAIEVGNEIRRGHGRESETRNARQNDDESERIESFHEPAIRRVAFQGLENPATPWSTVQPGEISRNFGSPFNARRKRNQAGSRRKGVCPASTP